MKTNMESRVRIKDRVSEKEKEKPSKRILSEKKKVITS